MEDDYIDFQAGSLLTAGELNTFDTWQLYIDQELEDKTSNISNTLPGSYVTELIAGSNITLSGQMAKASSRSMARRAVAVARPTPGTGNDGLPEGSVNLYYTDARVESYVNGAGYVKGPVVSKLGSSAGTNIVLTPDALARALSPSRLLVAGI